MQPHKQQKNILCFLTLRSYGFKPTRKYSFKILRSRIIGDASINLSTKLTQASSFAGHSDGLLWNRSNQNTCIYNSADFILYKVVRKNRRVDLHVVHNIGTLDTQTRPKFVCYQNTRPFFCNPEISNLELNGFLLVLERNVLTQHFSDAAAPSIRHSIQCWDEGQFTSLEIDYDFGWLFVYSRKKRDLPPSPPNTRVAVVAFTLHPFEQRLSFLLHFSDVPKEHTQLYGRAIAAILLPPFVVMETGRRFLLFYDLQDFVRKSLAKDKDSPLIYPFGLLLLAVPSYHQFANLQHDTVLVCGQTHHAAISTTQLRRNMVQRMASLEKEPASEGVGNAALISIPSEPEAFAETSMGYFEDDSNRIWHCSPAMFRVYERRFKEGTEAWEVKFSVAADDDEPTHILPTQRVTRFGRTVTVRENYSQMVFLMNGKRSVQFCVCSQTNLLLLLFYTEIYEYPVLTTLKIYDLLTYELLRTVPLDCRLECPIKTRVEFEVMGDLLCVSAAHKYFIFTIG